MFFEFLGLFAVATDLATLAEMLPLSPEVGQLVQSTGPGIDPTG